MDPNGLRFWLLANEGDWSRAGAPPPSYDPERRTLALASAGHLAFAERTEEAEARLAIVPSAVDRFGTHAYYDAASRTVLATGAAPGAVVLRDFTTESEPTDIAAGHDGAVYFAAGGRVLLQDTRDRWDPVTLDAPGGSAFRIAALPSGGVLVLDRTSRHLLRVRGLPFPRRLVLPRSPHVFSPDPEDPTPPSIERLPALFEPGEDPVAIAAAPASLVGSDVVASEPGAGARPSAAAWPERGPAQRADGEAVVLVWREDGSAALRRVRAGGDLGPARTLAGVRRPFSVAWLDARAVAVLAAAPDGRTEVLTFGLEGEEPRRPLGGIYPLAGHDGGGFAHTLDGAVRYGATPAAGEPPPLPRRLVRLSASARARRGTARNARPIDGGRADTVWHRVYLEAVLPPGCGVELRLGTSSRPDREPEEWFSHVFGDLDPPPRVPKGVWTPTPSELPFHPGVLPCPLEPHRAGCFTVLVQRAGRRVTGLSGRYLSVRLELFGDGRRSPEIAALRVYASRFSYVERYLPRLYREQLFAPERDQTLEEGPPSPADFLERMLGSFEGILTPIEDRIANAHLLTDPASAPLDALDWLGRWVGFVFDPAYPTEGRREGVQAAMELHRWRGTARGLARALDIVTGGAVRKGEIVLLEGWRLRRTFATILGADLANEDDPLLVGVVAHGQSIVGDALILGEEERREFLSVFSDLLPPREAQTPWWAWRQEIRRLLDERVVDAFFDRLAFRLTVLVHLDVDEERLGLLRRVLELETPAHLEAEVARASHPLMVGLRSLIGADTFLGERPPPPPIETDRARLGDRGFLVRPSSLDPRLEGGPG